MKLPKFKLPKMRLTAVLWVIFALVVIIEGLLLYKYLYLNSKTADDRVTEKISVSEINLKVFE